MLMIVDANDSIVTVVFVVHLRQGECKGEISSFKTLSQSRSLVFLSCEAVIFALMRVVRQYSRSWPGM